MKRFTGIKKNCAHGAKEEDEEKRTKEETCGICHRVGNIIRSLTVAKPPRRGQKKGE